MRGVFAPVILLLLSALLIAAPGCRAPSPATPPIPTNPPIPQSPASGSAGLAPARYLDIVQAACAPPAGWKAEELHPGSHHTQQIWLSPSGRTAYGVVHFTLPFPVGHDLVLWFFLNELRHTQGEAKLLNKQWDANLRGLRFVAEGGLYRVRTTLLIRGTDGWAIYAGTSTHEQILGDELMLAEAAREHTQVQGEHRSIAAR